MHFIWHLRTFSIETYNAIRCTEILPKMIIQIFAGKKKLQHYFLLIWLRFSLLLFYIWLHTHKIKCLFVGEYPWLGHNNRNTFLCWRPYIGKTII